MAKSKQGTILLIIAVLTFAVLTLIFIETATAARQSGVLTRVTTGNRKIVGQNVPKAKQGAVSDALESALTDAFAAMVPQQVFAANLEFLYDRLLPGTRDYVVTYRVLGGMAHKNRYLVGVESKINLELLEKTLTDARILSEVTDKPRILFLIAEQTPDDLLPKYWWGNNPEPYSSTAEARILDVMAENRFKIAGTGPQRPDPGFYNIRFASIYDTTAAMALAREYKADMVVMGRAGATEAINRMGDEKTYDATIELTAWDLASGQKAVSCNGQAAAKSGLDQEGSILALTKAADLAAQDLAAKLDRFWTQTLRRENRFDVHIRGDGFLPRFIALKKRFKDMSDIENMQPREIGTDMAVMEMVYKGSPLHFADTVMLKTFDNFGIEIVEVTEDRVDIRFIDKQDDALPVEPVPEKEKNE